MAGLVRNGWYVYTLSGFLNPYVQLIAEVERLQRRTPPAASSHPKAKLLRRIQEIFMIEIPADPNARQFQLGNTLGPSNRNWRRAKFFGRFRLFFRFHSGARIIVLAWLNDENSLRRAGAHDDVYEVFRKRLERGDPPGDWDDLVGEAQPFPGD